MCHGKAVNAPASRRWAPACAFRDEGCVKRLMFFAALLHFPAPLQQPLSIASMKKPFVRQACSPSTARINIAKMLSASMRMFLRAMRADADDSGINKYDSLEINALDSKKPVFPPFEAFFLHLRRPPHRISCVAPFLGAPKK